MKTFTRLEILQWLTELEQQANQHKLNAYKESNGPKQIEEISKAVAITETINFLLTKLNQ
jgi:hypothetical protein